MSQIAQTHSLVDLIERSRLGFRGPDSTAYLEARGFELPGTPNRARHQLDGSWVIQLSNTEYFLLGSSADEGRRIAKEENSWSLNDKANYLLPRHDSHAWLQLRGPRIAEVMSKLCGVDMREKAFSSGDVLQTQVARLSAIVVNTGTQEEKCFELLYDRCSAQYMTEVVTDALAEFIA